MADTIFAPSTAPGRAGIAVVRVSGPFAIASGEVFGAKGLRHRQSSVRNLVDPRDGRLLDQALLLPFEAPNSFTGEDVLEFHLHGGRAVTDGILAVLATVAGLRPAGPGEFTRRSLENGKLDLAQVEGLGDLLSAETDLQAKQAIELMEGRLSRRTSVWRKKLMQARALVEASIDFSEEELPESVLADAIGCIAEVLADIHRELETSTVSERLRHGFEIALVGPPNVGKSTLLNYIANREAAITSEFAGTTRDILESRIDLAGLPLTFLDMAGLRLAQDPIEMIGVERARRRAATADIRVFLLESSTLLAELGVEHKEGDILCLPMVDRRPDTLSFGVSGVTGQGVGDLLDRISSVLRPRVKDIGNASHPRQQAALRHASRDLGRAMQHLRSGSHNLDLAATDLAAGIQALDFLVGRVDVEAVLGAIFENFCIGK